MEMEKVIERISKVKIVPIIKIEDIELAIPTVKALREGGITVAEITYRTAYAGEAIARCVVALPDVLIGAGTVTTVEQAEEAISYGAKFIVSPGFSARVSNVCKKHNILYLGGAATPTEIMLAIENGQKIIKFFPCVAFGGLTAIKSLAAAFPTIQFVPTGGINKNNIKEFLSYKKVIACGGSCMMHSDLKEVTRLSKELVQEINR